MTEQSWPQPTPTVSDMQVSFSRGKLNSIIRGSGPEFMSLLQQQCPTAFYVLSTSGRRSRDTRVDVMACIQLPVEVVSALIARMKLNYLDFTARAEAVILHKDSAENITGATYTQLN